MFIFDWAKRLFSGAMALLVTLAGWLGWKPPIPEQDRIAAVVTNIGSGFAPFYGQEYKFDLEGRSIWVRYHRDNWPTPAEPWDFQLVRRLSGREVRAFRQAARVHGLAGWEGWYMWQDPNYDPDDPDGLIVEPPTDGPVWRVEITFADGTQQSSGGYLAYPEDWEGMRAAFEALAGANVWS